MATGFRGTYVIAWSQISVEYDPGDGAEISIGLSFRWTGRAVRMDGPPDVLALGATEGQQRLQARVSGRVAGRVILTPSAGDAPSDSDDAHAAPRNSFVVTDGRRRYLLLLVEASPATGPLLLCEDGVPPTGELLRVVEVTGPGAAARRCAPDAGGEPVTGLGDATLIRTPGGLCRVADLVEGDPVSTRAGDRPLAAVERCRVSGARMLAYPHTRPVRIRAGTLGPGRPGRDLLIAPDQRVLLHGPQAEALFGTPDVLVAPLDLVDDRNVRVARELREAVYTRLVFETPQVFWADGVECDSARPDAPVPAADPCAARRMLAGWEMAVLRHGLRAAH